MEKKKFYITTPIYYPSDKLHIGHTYCTVATDTLARYHRLRGEDVMFLTGTDEHGQKIETKAREAGVTPKEFVDNIVEGDRGVKDLWKLMNISNDRFIRTTDDYHVESVQKIFKKMYETPALSRVNDFNYDPNTQLPEIPTNLQQYIGTGGEGKGYGVRGYDRGHMLPQASRYNNYGPNRMTYYGTNMMPQNSTLNQNIWATLEGKVRGWGGMGKYDTLYVVTGTHFANSKTISNANGPISVPSHCWKVLLRQRGDLNKQISECTADELKAIGFLFTNDAAGAATSISSAARSVKEIEALTGFKFFRNLDPAVADAVKSQKNTSDWSGL